MPPANPDYARARRALGLSLQGMAELLQLSNRRAPARYEDGSRQPDGPTRVAYAYALATAGYDPASFGLVLPDLGALRQAWPEGVHGRRKASLAD